MSVFFSLLEQDTIKGATASGWKERANDGTHITGLFREVCYVPVTDDVTARSDTTSSDISLSYVYDCLLILTRCVLGTERVECNRVV